MRSSTFAFASLNAYAAAFLPGDLVVYRVGDGSAALTSAATAVFLNEYTPAGVLVQSIAMPTSASNQNHILTASGSAPSEGMLNLSSDGQFITLTGYDAAVGTAGVVGSSSMTTARVVGVVDAGGNVDTSTALNAFSGNNIRTAITTNGTDMWVGGAVNGTISTTKGSTGTTFTQLISPAPSTRDLAIFGGQLYLSTTTTTNRVAAVGSGLPTSSGQTLTNLAASGLNTPVQFVLADLSALVAGFDTLYIADSGLGSLQKWSLVSGVWTLNNSISITGVAGLTGMTIGTTEQLYATTPTNLLGFLDATGYDQNLTGTTTTLATAGTNEAFRGVAFAPAPVPEPMTLVYVLGGFGMLTAGRRLFRRS